MCYLRGFISLVLVVLIRDALTDNINNYFHVVAYIKVLYHYDNIILFTLLGSLDNMNQIFEVGNQSQKGEGAARR